IGGILGEAVLPWQSISIGTQRLAEVLSQLRLEVHQATRNEQIWGRRPIDFGFDVFDFGATRIGNVSESVRAQQGELDVLPLLPEQRAVEAQSVSCPTGLPADLVVLQVVRGVGR